MDWSRAVILLSFSNIQDFARDGETLCGVPGGLCAGLPGMPFVRRAAS